jgi:dihydrofolate synthase/folylpolyglutamate synthase
MDYSTALQWLYGLQVHGIKLGLENMVRLCTDLGIETASSESRRYIHVAGTNGKGSVCAMAAAVCVESGKRVGLYTSPHLVSFRERIRLGSNLIPEEHVAELANDIRRLTATWDHAPTFFEVTTAMALAWFQRQRAEWVILETGLGGRLDATNVVTPAVSVITPIGFDHMQYLGDTIGAIAAEKAGIIKSGVPVVSSPQPPDAEAVLQETAQRLGSSIDIIRAPISEHWPMALAGAHQRMNAALAFAAVVQAGLRPDPRQVGQALSKVEWPGRFQSALNGAVILDGAHNSPAAEQLMSTWQAVCPGEKATLILGVLGDKDARGVCAPLLQIAERVFCVPARNPRSMNPHSLAELVRQLGDQPCTAMGSLEEAMREAKKYPERTLIAGSLFVVGEALARLELVPGSHEWSAQ